MKHEHYWLFVKVESLEEMTLRYRCGCGDEIVHPASAPAPPK